MPGRAAVLLLALLSAGCAGPTAATPAAAADPACRATLVRFDPDPADVGLPSLDGLSEAGRLALKILLETDTFTSDAVGEGGELPLQAESFRILFREDAAAAKSAFTYLHDRGMAAGKLFGLCGLWFLDPEACADGCAELEVEADDFTVRVFEGCIIEERPVAGIVRRPADADPAVPDIRGGAWPRMLRGGAPR